MPKIRTYTSPTAQRGLQPSDMGIRAAEEAARAMGAAGRSIGKNIEDIGQQIQERQDATDLTNANSITNTAILKGHQAVTDFADTADPNDPEYFDKITKHIDDTFSPALDASAEYSPRVQAQVQRDISDQKRVLLTRALGEHHQMQFESAMSQHETGIAALVRSAVFDPASLPDTLNRIDKTNHDLIGHGISPTKAAEMSATDRASAALAVAGTLVEKLASDPTTDDARIAALRANINDPDAPFQPNLTGEQLNAVNAKLDGLGQTQRGVTFGLVKQQLPDLMTAIDRGQDPAQARGAVAWLGAHAKSKEEILAANDAAHDLAQHETYGGVFAKTRDLPNADIQTAINKTREAWASATTAEERARLKGQEQALTQARDQRNGEFHADPAAYSIANDGATNARYRAFAAQPTPQSWLAYSTAASAYQRRLFPGEPPKLVTAEVRDNIRQSVQAITFDKTNGVNTAAGTLQKWAGITGSNWTGMSRELHSAGILNDDQFVAATLYGKPSGRHLAEEMLRNSAMTTNELYLLHGVSSDKAAQAAIEQLQPLSESLGNMGEDGAEIQRANTLALAHLIQGRTNGVDQATELAKTILLDEFQFAGRHGSTTLRIPNRPDLDSGRIQAGTDSVLDSIGKGNVIVPFSNSGLNPGDQRKVYLDRIQHTGVWYANGSNTGAELWDIDGGAPVQERDSAGKPQKMFRTWRQLQDMGAPSDSTATSTANISTMQSGHKHY